MTDDLFSGFMDDDDLLKAEAQPTEGTLLKVLDSTVIKVGYILDGQIDYLKQIREFLVDAEMSQYTSKEAVGAYSEGMISDMQRKINLSYKIVNERPTAEQRTSALLFDREFKHYAEEENNEYS